MSHVVVAIPGLDRIAGAERQAMLLAMGLCRRGWRVTMLALSGSGGNAAAELRDAGVDFLSLHMRKGLADPRGWIHFHRWLRRERPDVVHAHLPHAALLARWSRLGAPVPVVIDTVHNTNTGPLVRHIGYRCSRWLPNHVTAVSQAAAASHVAAGMVNESRLSVVGNGVELERWHPDAEAREAARQALGIKNQFLWLAVGRLVPAKDYPTLLDALARAPESTRLLVLGVGPLKAELEQMAERLGLKPRVHFAGFDPNVMRWMQAADGLVLSSRWEGLPMVLLEAGACEVPAVATDVPGTREAIVDGQTGWLTPAGDPGRLAAAMNALVHAAPSERRAMGMRARRYVIEHFSLEAAVDRWEGLYADLLDQERAKRRLRLMAWGSLRRRSAMEA